jgi:hypothetical protein
MGFWKSLAKVATYPVMHPQRTAKGAVATAKAAAIAIPAGYVGWEKLTTDKSVARIVGETMVGKNAVDGVASVVGDLNNLRESAGTTLDKVNNTLSDVNSGMSGIQKFFQGMLSGNGGSMLGNFFSNLGAGKVSGLGVAGLVAGALLAFGRFGWFGKIAGALLSMFIIGNNYDYKHSVAGHENTETKEAEKLYSRASAYSSQNDTGKVFIKAWDVDGKECPAIELERNEYDSLVKDGYSPIQIYHGIIQLRREEENRNTGITR